MARCPPQGRRTWPARSFKRSSTPTRPVSSIATAGTGEDAGRTGELLAASGYLAPEAADGNVPDGRADVYGLGACLFEMLTGRPPTTGPSRGNNGPLSPRAIRAGVPRELDAV